MLRLWTPSLVARNSAYMLGSRATQIVLQGLQFIVLSRTLGPIDFGMTVAVTAFISALLPFSGLGLGSVTVIRIARGSGAAALYFGNAIVVTTVTAAICIGVGAVLATAFLRHPGIATAAVLFGFSEMLMAKYIDMSVHVFYGVERHGTAVVLQNLHLGLRLGAAIALGLIFVTPSALDWAVLHLSAGCLSAAVALIATLRMTGRPLFDRAACIRDVREGLFFSLAWSARSIHTDADKAIIARYASLETAGIYAAAFRLVYIAHTPVLSLLAARQPGVYRAGAVGGVGGSLVAMGRLTVAAAGYTLSLAVILYWGAWAVPLLLGSSYAGSTDVLRALCLLPFLLVLQGILSTVLAAADRQRLVALATWVTAGVAVVLNLALVPSLSWQGSVIAAYVAQALLVLCLAVPVLQARVRRIVQQAG